MAASFHWRHVVEVRESQFAWDSRGDLVMCPEQRVVWHVLYRGGTPLLWVGQVGAGWHFISDANPAYNSLWNRPPFTTLFGAKQAAEVYAIKNL